MGDLKYVSAAPDVGRVAYRRTSFSQRVGEDGGKIVREYLGFARE